jgi:hypothetical protein
MASRSVRELEWSIGLPLPEKALADFLKVFKEPASGDDDSPDVEQVKALISWSFRMACQPGIP